MKLRSLLTIALAAAFVFVAPITAKADETAQPKGWQQDSKGWWYECYDENGEITYAKDEVRYISGDMYYFDENGYMTTGWSADAYSYDQWTYEWDEEKGESVKVEYKENGINWRYADDNGVLQTGWQNLGGKWYYFNIHGGVMYEDGTREIYPVATDEYGWTYYDHSKEPTLYHFAPSGEMTTGWYWHSYPSGGGQWYYSDADGVVQTKWVEFAGKWYYFNEYDGSMKTGFYNTSESGYVSGEYYYVTGETYFLGNDGAMVTGWYNRSPQSVYGNWVFCNTDGTVYDGWLQSGADWYYFDDGVMRQNQYVYEYADVTDAEGNVIGREVAKRYFMGRDGAMITGWYDMSYTSANYEYEEWMFANPDGTIEEQWVQAGGDWYWIQENGYMYAGGSIQIIPEGMATPKRSDYNSWDEYEVAREKFYQSRVFVFDEDGKLVTNDWLAIKTSTGVSWYYADANGNGYTGWVQNGGNWYYCQNGYMQVNKFVAGGYWVGADGVWR